MKYKLSSCTQRGNALFLILIAVALFAALSYAIVQSNRGESNAASAEDFVVLAGQVVEQPAYVRSAIAQMIVSTPAGLITYTGAASPDDVFDQVTGGGGATNLPPPPNACSPLCTVWVFPGFTDATHGLFVGGVGTDAPESLDILPNITLPVCTQIQKGLGFTSTVPPMQGNAAFNWTNITNAISQPGGLAGSATTINDTGNTLDAQEFSCVNNQNTGYFYYHVLIAQ